MSEILASLGEVDEFGELLLILFVVIAVGYVGKKLSGAAGSLFNLAGVNNGTIGPNQLQGTGVTLTADQARSIAVVATGSPTNYTLSPDGKQVWFYNGNYYDVATGHLFDSNGNDLGALSATGGAGDSGQISGTADTAFGDGTNPLTLFTQAL